MQYRPEVRQDDLTMEEVGDDLLVYDSRHLRVHRLNLIAAFVLRFSDGTRTVHEVASCLQSELGFPADEELVWFALEKLAKVDLLTEVVTPPRALSISRRSLMRKARAAGVMTLVLPVVESIFAPSPTQAASPSGAPTGPAPINLFPPSAFPLSPTPLFPPVTPISAPIPPPPLPLNIPIVVPVF